MADKISDLIGDHTPAGKGFKAVRDENETKAARDKARKKHSEDFWRGAKKFGDYKGGIRG